MITNLALLEDKAEEIMGLPERKREDFVAATNEIFGRSLQKRNFGLSRSISTDRLLNHR